MIQSTKEIKVPENIIDQVIGQEEAVRIIRKAANQRRHVLLIGEPGTGKSMLGLALAELLPKSELKDTLAIFNPNDDNNPTIMEMPAGKGREEVQKYQLDGKQMLKNNNFLLFIVALLTLIAPWWVRYYYKSDLMFTAFFLGGMLFLAAFAIMTSMGPKMFKISNVISPKVIVDNFGKKTAPFYDACLLPGQRVLTIKKPEKIEETTGKIVYNYQSKPQKVTKVECKPYQGKIYHIKPRLLLPFTATPNHPFLVLKRTLTKQFKRREFLKLSKKSLHLVWKRAEELVPGDMLVYPSFDLSKEFQKISFVNKKNRKTINDIIIDEEIAEVLGWYLAEGYCRKGKRRAELGFVLARDEEKEALRIKETIEKRFNLAVKIDLHHLSAIELKIYSETLRTWLQQEFGMGAKTKKIPSVIFTSPLKVKIAFLNAYIAGDGYHTPDGVSFATASKGLAEEITFLLTTMGIFPSSHERDLSPSVIAGRKIKGPHLFEFYISGNQLQRLGKKQGNYQHYFSKDNLHFVPIRKIWTEEYKGDIINMETEDGTYLMPCVTHNTGAHAGALLGDVLHDPFQSGGLGTPANQRVVAGMIHKAHLGVLFIDEIATLHPRTQQELLSALQEKKFPITGQSERSAGAMVRTEPVPCDFVLIAAGNLETLKQMHPALRSRITGYGYEIYMNETISDTKENRAKIARFVAQEVKKENGKIPHFSIEALKEIVEEARRRANHKGHLTLHLRSLGGLVRAAGDLAKEEKAELVEREHVTKAKVLARPLEQQIADKFIERKKEYEVIVTSGKRVGRVNGLAVIGGGSAYSGILLPIEAEVTPGGKKSEIIATGKLGEIAKEAIKNVSAIIMKYFGEDIKESKDVFVQFLQTYEGVEGDSASIAVATAIISALKDIPVKQEVAMTGSLSVRGEVLPVGGVSSKVEAAIATGIKIIIVPKSNLQDIVIDEKKLSMVKIIPVSSIEEVLEYALDWSGKSKIKEMIDKSKTSPAQKPAKHLKTTQKN